MHPLIPLAVIAVATGVVVFLHIQDLRNKSDQGGPECKKAHTSCSNKDSACHQRATELCELRMAETKRFSIGLLTTTCLLTILCLGAWHILSGVQ